MRGYVTLELFFRHVGGIKVRACRLVFVERLDERLIFGKAVIAAAMGEEVVVRRAIQRRSTGLLREARAVLRILLRDLQPEDLVDVLRCLDQVCTTRRSFSLSSERS
jgi:hypothetical protein